MTAPRPFPARASRLTRTLLRCAMVCAILIAGSAGRRASAQTVRVGVRAGPTFGFLNDSAVPFVARGDATANLNVRLDLHAGAYAIFPLSGRYGLQTELLYVRMGGHFSRFGDTNYRAERYRLSYVQGQVLGRRNVALPGPLRLHLVGGLTGKGLVGATVQRAVHTEVRVTRQTIDLAAQRLVRRWDVGALFGVGLGYPVGRTGRVTLALRYNRGFRSVFTDEARAPEARRRPRVAPPLTGTPPAFWHDVITASLSFDLPLDR